MCTVLRVPTFSSSNKIDLWFQSFLLPRLILAMEVGTMVLGVVLLPRSVDRILIRSVDVLIWSSIEVGGVCCAAPVKQGNPSLGSWRVPSSGGPCPASTASSPSSHFTSPLPPRIQAAQTASLVGSRYDQGYGVKASSSCNIRISRPCLSVAPICSKNLSQAATLSHAILESSGMMQVNDLHMREGDRLLFLIFFTRSGVVMSMWWRHLMPGCDASSYHHVLCLAIMVVAGNSGVLVWEDHIAAFEASSPIIQVHVLHIRVPHGYAQVPGNVRLDGCMWPLVLLQLHWWWSPRACRSVSTSSSSKLYCYLSGCGTSYSLQAAVDDEYAFLLFGIRRRRVRAVLLRILRFNSQEPPDLSSVIAHLDLQLISLPHRHLPTRLLVEPLALRLVRLQEAPEVYGCRCFESEFSTDPWKALIVLFCINIMFRWLISCVCS